MINREWLEQIDACRPGFDDIESPDRRPLALHLESDVQARAVYDRLQETDAALVEAMHAVDAPPGIEERLLERLAVGRILSAEPELMASSSPNVTARETAPVTGSPVTRPPVTAPSRRRRRSFAGIGLAAAAGLLFVIFGPFGTSRSPLDLENLASKARQFFNQDSRDGGKLLAKSPAPKGFPSSVHVITSPNTRWRDLNNFLGHPAVAFDLSGPKGGVATLYVVDAQVAELANNPQSVRATWSGGLWVLAWQENDRLCVLVVRDKFNRRAHKSFLRLFPVA